MEMNLQFGFGMMDHSRSLIESWGGGKVILSPRDLTSTQLERLGNTTIRKLNGASVWLDPQFYLPHADHERLCSHDYWPPDFQTGIFWQGPSLEKLITELIKLNNILQTHSIVLPGMLARPVDDDWFVAQEAVIDEIRAREERKPLICTIALSDESVMDINQISELIEKNRKVADRRTSM